MLNILNGAIYEVIGIFYPPYYLLLYSKAREDYRPSRFIASHY